MKISRWLILVSVFLLLVVIGVDIAFLVRLNTPDTATPYPLMHDGYGSPEQGPVIGEIFITDSSPSHDEWRLLIDNWPVSTHYAGPTLYYDRTAANHELVTWNILDASLFIQDDNALLFYNVDGETYLAWGTPVRSQCYGGATKWQFGNN